MPDLPTHCPRCRGRVLSDHGEAYCPLCGELTPPRTALSVQGWRREHDVRRRPPKPNEFEEGR